MPEVPRLFRLVTAIACMGVLASAIVYTIASLVLSTKTSYPQLGFEPIVVIACVFGILFSLGKFAWAPAMTLFTIAGTLAVATVLVYVGMNGRVEIKDNAAGWSLKPFLAARLACAAVLAALAGVHVLSRERSARASFLRGVGACVPLIASVAGVAVAWRESSFASGAGASPGMSGWVAGGLLALLIVVAGVCACIAGHYLIRAFEIGADVGEGRFKPVTPPTDARSS